MSQSCKIDGSSIYECLLSKLPIDAADMKVILKHLCKHVVPRLIIEKAYQKLRIVDAFVHIFQDPFGTQGGG